MSDKKKTTTRDIAKACFVSQSAVSMILSGRTDMHFSRETIALVQETAAKMGYVYKPQKPTCETGYEVHHHDHVPVSLHAVLHHADPGHHAGGTGKRSVCADRLHRPAEEREMYYLHMAEDNAYYGIIYTFAPKAVAF